MKTKLIFNGACFFLMLLPIYSFCQLKLSASTNHTYNMTIDSVLPQKIYTNLSRQNRDSTPATFVFIEFGDGSFATSYTGINSHYIKHDYSSNGAYRATLLLSPTYDTTKRPQPVFFSKQFSNIRSIGSNQTILQNEEKLKITPSVSDSKILLSDSTITFAITYKLDVHQTLPVTLTVNYNDGHPNIFYRFFLMRKP